ncbi:MAG: hypothetical protein NTW49_13805 [Bacteroidia bacterium]|nr:hypothetical protein [Bacteroidia bacterium]
MHFILGEEIHYSTIAGIILIVAGILIRQSVGNKQVIHNHD